jgi:hypothetical protein
MFDRAEQSTHAARLTRELDVFLGGAGYGRPGSIPADMTFLDWCRDLAAKGLKVDNKPFDLEDRPSLTLQE